MLDPTVRRLRLPGGTPVVVADTVGFIRDLPHELVAAFQSTLTEAREANLLLHVIDASDPRRAEHIEEVERVLDHIGAGEIPSIRVFNKIDRLEIEPRVDRGEDGAVESVWISAARGVGLELLGRAVAERLQHGVQRMRLTLPLTEGAARARLYAAGVVLDEAPSTEGFDLLVDLPDSEVASLGRLPGAKLVPVASDTLEFSGKTHRRQSGWRQPTLDKR
jgi:GTP-binding protein HflX